MTKRDQTYDARSTAGATLERGPVLDHSRRSFLTAGLKTGGALAGKAVLLGTAGATLAACAGGSERRAALRSAFRSEAARKRAEAEALYAAMPNEQFPLPAVDLKLLDERFYRRRVDDPTGERPGTIVVDTTNFYLYLVEPGGTAMRYGVGLGRAGFEWAGRARVAYKKKWPTWTPPARMIRREPHLAKYSAANGGMKPGLLNPLGARALYIFQGRRDTLYRLHGSPEVRSIGKAVSSGCVRLINQDVIDLYNRTRNGARILVK
ncbi:MAG: L,D-transpeptidase [Pseudomonadota bacterium]